MKRSGKILLEGTIEEFKKHAEGADNREYVLINTKEIKKDGTYTTYEYNRENNRVINTSYKGKYGKKPYIHNYSRDYLTFIALSDGTFAFTGNEHGTNCLISYSTDGGNSWSEPSSTVEVNVQSGDKVLWKGEMRSVGSGPTASWLGIGSFKGSALFLAQGNPKSLLYKDNFVNLPLTVNCFCLLFGTNSYGATPAHIVDASNMSMDTEVCSGCYQLMFLSCKDLIKAPQLPATTLADYCYTNMFSYCSKLNYIKMLATDISANLCLSYWTTSVASSGTFVKNANMNSLTPGSNGIPSGWTVVDYVEE